MSPPVPLSAHLNRAVLPPAVGVILLPAVLPPPAGWRHERFMAAGLLPLQILWWRLIGWIC